MLYVLPLVWFWTPGPAPPAVLTDLTVTERRDDRDLDNWTENIEDFSSDERRKSAVDECLFGLSRLNSDRCCSLGTVIDFNWIYAALVTCSLVLSVSLCRQETSFKQNLFVVLSPLRTDGSIHVQLWAMFGKLVGFRDMERIKEGFLPQNLYLQSLNKTVKMSRKPPSPLDILMIGPVEEDACD